MVFSSVTDRQADSQRIDAIEPNMWKHTSQISKRKQTEQKEPCPNRRTKRQKVSSGYGTMSDEEKKKIQRKLRAEAMKEARPIALGSLAMLASSLSNQGEHSSTNRNSFNSSFHVSTIMICHQRYHDCSESCWTKALSRQPPTEELVRILEFPIRRFHRWLWWYLVEALRPLCEQLC